MKSAVCKFFSASLVLIATSTLNAQNLMNRIYTVPSLGVINRGDFNEDGIPDVLFLTSDGVEVGLSNSQGKLTFLPSSGNTQGDGGDFSVARFTSSGHLDVAITRSAPEGQPPTPIDILLGHGDGTFTVGQTITLPGGVGAGGITTSDFDGDGKADLAVLSSNKILIFPGKGDGTFASPKTVTTTFGTGFPSPDDPPFEIRVGDFDGDGRPDFAIRNERRAAVLFNNGNFTFQQKDITGETAFFEDFAPADVNQDGFTDLLVSLRGDCPPSNSPCEGGYAVYTSQGSARTFKVTFRLAPSFNNFPPFNLIAADVDGDGINDILYITGSFHPTLHLAKGNVNGSFGTPRAFTLSNINGATGLVSLDLNRDGRPDFVTTNSVNGELFTSLNAFARSACTASTVSPSVTVCQPTDNTFSKSPLHIVAKATDTAHPITSMQVYVDGQLKSTNSTASMDTSLSLPLGAHLLTVKAWDSSGKNFRSLRHLNIFSGTSGQVCSVRLNAVRICIPTQNATVGSSARVLAASNSNFENTAIQVYLDHQLVFEDDSANFIDRTFTLTPGTHSLTVKAWDVTGQQLSQSETIHVSQ
jgi:hypothetical protein